MGKYLLTGRVSSIGMYGLTTDTRVYAIIDIRLKDQRAKIEIKPASEWQYDKNGATIYNYGKESAIRDMQQLKESFKNAITVATDDDW